LLLAILATIVVSGALAAPKKSSLLANGGDEIPKDVFSYASNQNIDIHTATRRLALQGLAGN